MVVVARDGGEHDRERAWNQSQASGALGALLYYPLMEIPPSNPGSLSKDWMARLAKVGALWDVFDGQVFSVCSRLSDYFFPLVQKSYF